MDMKGMCCCNTIRILNLLMKQLQLMSPFIFQVCHVGRHRTYPEEAHPQVLERIEKYISSRCQSPASSSRSKTSPSLIESSSNHSVIIRVEDDPPLDKMEDADKRGVASHADDACISVIDSASLCDNALCASDVTVLQTSADGHSQQGKGDVLKLKGRGEIAKNLAPNFKPRDAEERVKNCGRLERSLKDGITLDVAWAILEDGGVRRRVEDVEGGPTSVGDEDGLEELERSVKSAKLWRKGGKYWCGFFFNQELPP